MDRQNIRRRTVGVLLVLGSILVLIASWDLPETAPHASNMENSGDGIVG